MTLYSTSRDRGERWSDPQVYMADFAGGVPSVKMLTLRDSLDALMIEIRTTHDEIGIDPERRIRTSGSDYFKSRTRAFLRHSRDGGRSFDFGAEIPYQDITGGPGLPSVGFYGSLDAFIQLKSGRVLAAFMYMDPTRSESSTKTQHYTVACLLSEDAGTTWRRGGEITSDTPRGVMEVQIVETAPNGLFCLFRTKAGCLYQTRSSDGGETWSESVPSPLTAPESMARMIRLRSGSLLCVWNSTSSTTQKPRYPLVAALSTDSGEGWSEPRMIATECGENQLSNHGMIELDDGRVLVGLSHYHAVRPATSDLDVAVLDENWVRSGSEG